MVLGTKVCRTQLRGCHGISKTHDSVGYGNCRTKHFGIMEQVKFEIVGLYGRSQTQGNGYFGISKEHKI